MKMILLVVLLFSGVECSTGTTVYVCDSPNAKKYHYKENCRGFGTCQRRIAKMSLENAKEKGLTLCKWEQDH